jgi:hypothetical protein
MSAFSGMDTKDIWSWQAGVESCIGGIQFFAGGADLAIGLGLIDMDSGQSRPQSP